MNMQHVLEFLQAVALVATTARTLFELWREVTAALREHKHRNG